MAPRASKPKSTATIPENVADQVRAAIDGFQDPALNAGLRGRFCYILHRGQPICRLGFRPGEDLWDFAIYKYSTGTYSSSDIFLPRKAPLTEGIRTALLAYDLA